MATPHFAMGKKWDAGSLLKQFSGWLWCALALSPGSIWQMVHNLSKISSVESFWSVEMFKYFIEDPDLEHLIIDSTTVRAHPSSEKREAGGDTALRFMRV